MDNITHSLVGLLTGSSFARGSKDTRRAILIASLVANNVPDADILYAGFLSRPLGYVLHHRGHTHTLVGALAIGVATAVLTLFFCRRLRQDVPLSASRPLLGVSVVGALLHLLLDSLNTYGVHPFWPIDDRWYYGDSVFIIEPTLWISLALAALCSARQVFLKILLFLLIVAAIALIVASGYVPPQVILLLALTFAFFALLSWSMSAERRAAWWSVVSVLIVAVFATSGAVASAKVVNAGGGGERVLAFSGPSPANPFCWSYLEVVKGQDSMHYRQQFVQPFEGLLSLDCSKYSLFRPKSAPSTPSMETSVNLGLFRAAARSCRWLAFLQFARVPFLTRETDGVLKATDLRFARSGSNGLLTLPLEGDCPQNLPPWLPPVSPELLQ